MVAAVVGDVMLDALTDTAARLAHDASRLVALGVAPSGYLLATVHRAANTDNPARLRAIIAAFGAVAEPVLWPMHPRTRHVLAREGIMLSNNIRAVEPLGYLDLVAALQQARAVVPIQVGFRKRRIGSGFRAARLLDVARDAYGVVGAAERVFVAMEAATTNDTANCN